MKNILVTGSDGYIGAVLMQKLIAKGYKATGWDNFYYRKNILGNSSSVVKSKKKDIRDVSLKDLSKFDAIIHLAALSNDPLGEINPKITREINHTATIKLAKYAKKAGVKRFIFSSSCSIYGISKNEVVSEKSPVNPLTAYAKSKIESENELKKLADENFCVCLLRNSTVYGFSPKLRADLVINDFVLNGIMKKEIIVFSDGTPWRPLIDIRDLSEVFIKFLVKDSKKINGEIFNIGFNKNNVQVKQILNLIKKELPRAKITHLKKDMKDQRSYRVDFDKFHKIFPEVSQKWPLQKSIKHLIVQIRKARLTTSEFNRISSLRKLLDTKKIDKNLRWS